MRHRINVVVAHRLWKSKLPEKYAQSLDISEGGIYFATDATLEEGDTVEVRFHMPEAIVSEPASEWLCTGRVVRVDRVGGIHGKLGVGVRFDCYEVARPQGTTVVRLGLNASRFGRELPTSDRTPFHR